MFGFGKRTLEEKFTKSELVLLAWRSQEVSAQMDRQTQQAAVDGAPRAPRRQTDAMIPPGLPDKFFNKDGDVDLRQVTGEEAYRYLSSMGMRLPIMFGNRG